MGEPVMTDAAALYPVLDALPHAVVQLGLDGRVLRWNAAASALLGWPAFALRAPAQYLDANFRALVASGTVEPVEMRVHREGAPAATCVVTARPVADEHHLPLGTVLLLEDVTEPRRLAHEARQTERLEAMSQLSGVVAHDFNNLLTTIVGYSQLLARQVPDDPGVRESVDAIDRAAKRARELTSGLASVGRRRVVQPVLVDPAERVRALEPVLQRLVKESVDLRIVTSAERAQVRLDPNELGQAVTSLVLNANEAMPEGGHLVVDVRPVVLVDDAAGSYVVLTVGDTGVGMTDDVRQRCFDPFFTTKGRRQGAGIGLTAVYGVVTQAGGRIEVTSRPGGGSTFRLYLPAAVDAPAPGPAPATAEAPTRRRRRKLHVLLVDDEPDIRVLARAVLESAGHTVVEAGDSAAAVACAESSDRPFDVVVSDIVMPGEHGDVLARRLMARQPDLVVLLMSGYVERTASLDADRVAFLAKPFAPDELADQVATLAPRRPRRTAPTARIGSRRP